MDLSLSINEARRKRHEAGILKYRQDPTGPYVGNPLLHLYEELLDAMNYYDEAERQSIYDNHSVRCALEFAAEDVREKLNLRAFWESEATNVPETR